MISRMPSQPRDPDYRVYLMDVSYFSGKLEAYLRYKEIPFERVEVGWRQLGREVFPNTGIMKVPVVETAGGDWLQDSTPIIDWMEARHPEPPIIPEDPLQAFCARLLEDYADEWLWRPALHYRWSHAADARLLGRRIASEVMKDIPGPLWLLAAQVRFRQRRECVRGDGVTAATRAHVEGVYTKCLERLEPLLGEQPFLLGGRPCLADFGFFAAMFRHFSLDPTPARIMRDRAPAVYAWVSRLWNARASRARGEWPQAGVIPAAWHELLRDAGETYLPYLHANAMAWRDGSSRFDWSVQGVRYLRLPVVHYRVWCRERLQEHFEAIPAHARPALEALLGQCGAWEPLWRDGKIASHLHAETEPPVCWPVRSGLRGAFVSQSRPWNPARGSG